MDRAQLIESLPALRDDLHAVRARALAAASEVEALEKIVEGIEALIRGDRPTFVPGAGIEAADENSSAPETPRGREAVRRVLQETGTPWKLQALIAEIQRRGWIDPAAKQPAAAIRTAVGRLAEAGEVERVGAATYRYKGVTESEA